MPWLDEIRRRLRVLLHRERFDNDLAEELQFHLEMQAGENRQRGMDDGEAACAAQRQFGNVTRIRELSRDTWGWTSLESWMQDIRYCLRQLAAAKGFAFTAVLTLALGIGANTGIFTLIHGLLLKSLPVADPASLVRIGAGDNCCVLGSLQDRYSVFSYPLYKHLRDTTPEIAELAALQAGMPRVGVRRAGVSAATPFVTQFVSGNYFSLLGLRPLTGRLLGRSDDTPGAPPTAVMSYRVWQQHYGADPSVIGQSFIIAGTPFTIVGVAPPGFFGAVLRTDPPDFWMPVTSEPAVAGKNALLLHSNPHWLYLLGRLKPGVEPASLAPQLSAKVRAWLLEHDPPPNAQDRKQLDGQRMTIAPGGGGISQLSDEYENNLRLLLGITGLVLLIACANLANLQLTRGAASAGQNAIRVALGAPPSRLIRLVLIDSVVLSVVGGALGLLIASQTARLLLYLGFRGAKWIPIDTTPSPGVLAFTFLLSVASGVAFGLAPAWVASRAHPAGALRGAGRSTTGRSILPQRMLVVAQVALSLVLLAGAGLMMQTLRNLTHQQFGFRMENTVVVNVSAGIGNYPPEKFESIYSEIKTRVAQLPGVRNVALALYSPMTGNNWQMNATLEDRPQQPVNPSWNRVSHEFFSAIGARIIRGRDFTEADRPGTLPVAVVSRAFADAYFPNQDPIGKRFGLGGPEHRADYTIVGVVETIRFRQPRRPAGPMFFVPLLQMSAAEWQDKLRARSNIINSVILSTGAPTSELTAQLSRTLGAVDPNLTMVGAATASDLLDQQLSREQMIGVLVQVFGALALLLACVGLYGVASYSVARRTSEIGVRTALGATRAQVFSLVLKGAMTQTAIGLAIGIPASLFLGRVLAGHVYGVRTSDPLTITLAASALVVCAALAGAIPARRATRIDPVVALRAE